MTADNNLIGDNYTYDYDGSGRLQTVRKNGVVAASYGYDAFERRVTRTVGGSERHYLFDQAGRRLAEHDGTTGAVLREYIWLEDMLVAMVDGGEVFAVHGGHLGQPLIMTDELGLEVWNAEYAPFGGALPSTDFDDPGLRYPGQWAEGETQLFQNWHRDYDPSLGRYIQADPIGLAAGQSLYGYVGADPVNYVDPDGLEENGLDFILPPFGEPGFVCGAAFLRCQDTVNAMNDANPENFILSSPCRTSLEFCKDTCMRVFHAPSDFAFGEQSFAFGSATVEARSTGPVFEERVIPGPNAFPANDNPSPPPSQRLPRRR
ncbi:MAG: RHS repeat-associated core domain-containing protein [Pseudomonadota bacterium]